MRTNLRQGSPHAITVTLKSGSCLHIQPWGRLWVRQLSKLFIIKTFLAVELLKFFNKQTKQHSLSLINLC